jgi:hypothetical protein
MIKIAALLFIAHCLMYILIFLVQLAAMGQVIGEFDEDDRMAGAYKFKHPDGR